MSGDDECRETLQGITNNGKLSEGYLMLARDIEVMEPKSSEDIISLVLFNQTHLLHGRASVGLSVNSAGQNLATTFVNAFVNTGFDHDVDSGLAQIDKYLHSDDKNVIASASLGVGILSCGFEHECDPMSSMSRFLQKRPLIALPLLADYVDKEDSSIKIGAIMGLGLAYAGAQCP
ncbi:hypothetical protein ACSBR2_000602 [Camellia fascicularis]